MKKKLLALLLSGAMILSLTTPVALAEEPEGECCGSCGQAECVCPPEEAPCEVCGEIKCVCEEVEELPEEEVPGAAAPEIPEEPTACELCGEIECGCEKIEEPEVPEVPETPVVPENPETPEIPEEPTACEECGEIECICEGVNDYAELYEALMACESAGDAEDILDGLSEEEVNDFALSLSEAELECLMAHLDALADDEELEGIVVPFEANSFTNAAPLVTATEKPRMRRATFALRSALADVGGLETSKTATKENDDYKIVMEA